MEIARLVITVNGPTGLSLLRKIKEDVEEIERNWNHPGNTDVHDELTFETQKLTGWTDVEDE